MRTLKSDIVIQPIYERMVDQYVLLYKNKPSKKDIEMVLFEEILKLEQILSLKDALLFSHFYSSLESDLSSQEHKVWRSLLLGHFVYLFGKKILAFDFWLFIFISESVTKENIHKMRYLSLLTDQKWIRQVFEHVLLFDFSATLTSKYKIDHDRLRKVFRFMCLKIEELSDILPEEMELEEVKKQVLKKIKTYQSKRKIKRNVRK